MGGSMRQASETVIELSIRVTDGSFDTRIAIPVNSSEEQRASLTKMWLEQLSLALKLQRK